MGDLQTASGGEACSLHEQALQLLRDNQPALALKVLERVAQLEPHNPEFLKTVGNARKAVGDMEGATRSYRAALQIRPDYAPAWYNLGLVFHLLNRLEEAEDSFRRVHELDPNDADALFHLVSLLTGRSRYSEAMEMCRKALSLTPENPHLWMHLGIALQEIAGGALESAECLAKSIVLQPDLAEAHYHLARAHKRLGRMEDAVAAYQRSLELGPAAEAHNDLANIFQDEGRVDAALAHYQEAIRLAPGFAIAHGNLGCALVRAHRLAEAAESFQRALALDPGYAGGHLNLGSVRSLEGARDQALHSYRAALKLRANDAAARECLVSEMQHTCEWEGFEALCDQQRRSVDDASQRISPFSLLSIPSTPAQQLQCARNFALRHSSAAAGQRAALGFRFDRMPRDKLTIGYLSADFHDHVTSYVMAELFELHDRSRFNVVAYSYGPDDHSVMRRRLMRAFDRFVDVAPLSHAEAARAIYADRVDILVDLKGYTQHARTEITARRPAPVQAAYMGYPGTLAADFIDYLVVDRFVVPRAQMQHYGECLVFLPRSYYVNDRKRACAEAPTRAELNLPDGAFVFCCFNQTYKILPGTFSVWMRLLAAVPRSVLWLLETNPWAKENLRREAQSRGIDPKRLIFAPRVAPERHLARIKAADIFLDTLPYNAHTTATDALWVGVPVVTCPGDTFASRVAGSLLMALDMPELITTSMHEYEALALRLARFPGELERLRGKLSANRLTASLFDTPRFTFALESAYEQMWRNYLAGAVRTIEV